MGSISSMSRENKKKQLKRQIVPNHFDDEEGSRETVNNAHRRAAQKRMHMFLIALCLAVGAVIIYLRYSDYHQYTSYQVSWERSLVDETQEAAARGEGSFCEYIDYAGGVLKYTKDGASYLDAQGKSIWIQSYEMKSPVVAVNGDFVAIGDRQGNSIYICDTNGLQGQATTLLPILQVSVSAKGVVAALQEDSKSCHIYLYRKDGSSLDISVKSLLSGDGYPVDVCLSPSGNQWITSFMYLEQGMIKNKIVFYNFGLGKNDPRRVVGIFLPEDLGDAMAGRVRFLDESHAVAFSDKGLQFFSTRVETSPESVKQVFMEENVRSISYSAGYVGVVADNAEGENPYILRIYTAEGAPVFEKVFDFQYTGFDIDGELVLLYNDSACRVYNMKGTEKFEGSFDFTVSKVSAGRFPGTLLVMGSQKMEEIKLQN